MEDRELLQYALEHGMIDMSYVQEQMEMNKRKEFLRKHPYEIWEGKDGKWYTYLPDENKGRKLKKRKTQEDIETCVIEFWKSQSEEEIKNKKAKSLTLKTIFPEWLRFKQAHTNSTSYVKRITADWARFYQNDTELINIPLYQLTKIYLDNWAHNKIKEYEMTKKMYYNMSIILRQSLDYAVENGYIDKNVFTEVKINTKMFRRVKKKTGETEVYSPEEEKNLVMDMFRRFNENPDNTAPLAVILQFEIGVRIGELCAIKTTDISGNYVTIQRQEVREFEPISDYKMRFKGFKIVEYTKSDDGYRQIYLTTTAREIISYIQMINRKNREPDNSFLFIRNGKNINHHSVQAMIVRGCERIGIPVKTSHKIRKTFISTLIDSNLNIDEIRRIAGHSDERVTYQNYCYNRFSDAQTEKMIENALNAKKVIKGNQIFKLLENTKAQENRGFAGIFSA